MRISLEKLEQLLRAAHTQPIGLVTATRPKMRAWRMVRGRKVWNPFRERGVVKLADRSGFAGPQYERLVNRQRAREGRPRHRDGSIELFFPERLWRGRGRRIARCLAKHLPSQRIYLVFWPRTDLIGQPLLAKVHYVWADTGVEIDGRSVRPWLVLNKANRNRSQGTAKEIPWRTIRLENLVQLRMAGQIYETARMRALLGS